MHADHTRTGRTRRRVRTTLAVAGTCLAGVCGSAVPAGAAPAPTGPAAIAPGAAPFVPSGTTPPTAAVPAAGTARPGRSTVTSADWAGYVDTGATFTSVAGSWVQPASTCPTKKADQAAFWVGIGGYSSSDPDIEQIGTDADCTKAHGKKVPSGPSYYAWFQMYPRGLVVLPTSSYPVAPGQTFTASVSGSGPSYTLTLTDVGHWTYSTVQSQASKPAATSAEWITEAPTSCAKKCKVVPLTDFGAVGFSAASANGEAVNGPGMASTAITMTNKSGKKVYASTSGLGGSGNAFSVTWVAN